MKIKNSLTTWFKAVSASLKGSSLKGSSGRKKKGAKDMLERAIKEKSEATETSHGRNHSRNLSVQIAKVLGVLRETIKNNGAISQKERGASTRKLKKRKKEREWKLQMPGKHD